MIATVKADWLVSVTVSLRTTSGHHVRSIGADGVAPPAEIVKEVDQLAYLCVTSLLASLDDATPLIPASEQPETTDTHPQTGSEEIPPI